MRGKTFAILATHGFEQSELMEPKRALQEAGATIEIVSLRKGRIRGWRSKDWGDEIDVDLDLNAANEGRYDGLVLPGGTLNADTLRTEPRAINFVKSFFAAGKPVAAICHAPWLLVEAQVVAGHKLTSWPSLKTDVRNAGGEWVDETVVIDDQLVTSRKPDDIPAFNEAMIGLFAKNQRRAAARTTLAPGDVS
ncbi:type 1 glutamine amidotransferase domain-containing protein [Solimonas soli]|uniref:type 1 glutamine amidotransferase domain-containing protein n=1 Tax=Solimonas soli TaxID=413479 RepID=UPI000484D88C